jgi:hypothetical protein
MPSIRGWLQIPRWVNFLWALCNLAAVAYFVYEAFRLHLDFVQTVGYLWLSFFKLLGISLGSGLIFYTGVLVFNLLRGRRPPPKGPDEDLSSDIANLVP